MTTAGDTPYDMRARTVAYGELMLENWAEHRDVDFERIGARPDRTLERAKEMRDGLTKSTATHDALGDPLLDAMEKIAERAKTTLTVERWVGELPGEHRRAVNLFYVERRKIQQIASMLGVDRNHAGNIIDDSKWMIGSRALNLQGVNDPSHLGRTG
ncbi:sigma-70 family RNA polymerase sigma factor [Hydrocarboniphaga effusa]|uniref:sigma-70 family RNA polymerase sigma factor n=1 Tax=Hydrocarboniphaga effusa TaxID=243629 RepID=UPI003BABCD30